MADIDYCEACESLKQIDPNLVANGITDTECANLAEDKGLSGTNTDCEDLNTMNDCLIGGMDEELELHDVCNWKDYMHKLVPNHWTMTKGIVCAICGIWEQIHELWRVTGRYTLSKSGNTITLTGPDGNHGSVTDDNTTYTMSQDATDGHKITITGSDGYSKQVTIPDNNTKYDLVKSGNTITLVGSDGTRDDVTDANTKYTLSKTGSTIKLTGTDGATTQVTDANTTYTLSQADGTHDITMAGSDGSSYTVKDTRYRLHTSTYTKTNVTIAPDSIGEVTLTCNKPPSVPTDLAPMAVAGWTLENGTNVRKVSCRYIQLIDRQTNQCQVKAVFYNAATSSTASFNFMPEVLWWGLRTTSE